MMNAARSFTSWSVSLSFPPLGGMAVPDAGLRPFVMVSIRNAGLKASVTPGSCTIGFSAGPTPPSRPLPWHWAQPDVAYNVSPLLGSPGSVWAPVAAEPPPAVGDGELSAIVDIAVRTKKAGTPTASSRPRVTRIEAKSYLG